MEIERKFLLTDGPPSRAHDSVAEHIRQGYLAIAADREVRLRDASGAQTLTVKSSGDLAREEYEVEVTSQQFEALWPATSAARIEKTRHHLDACGRDVSVDEYVGALEGLVVAEVEFASEGEAVSFEPPAWFGPEVTTDPRFKNASLARYGMPDRAGGRDR